MKTLEIVQVKSPNCGPRRDGLRPKLIVLHYTAMASAAATLDRLCDSEAEVSAHYLIGADGGVTQLVPEKLRAWHAGDGEWRGEEDVNSRSIGIELDNRGNHPFSEPQMAALEALMRGIMARWDIPAENVIGHSDCAIGRKIDPGARFDWARLECQGLARKRGAGTRPDAADPATFRACAQETGFTAPADDTQLLAAVRLRYRPHGKGPLSVEDYISLIPNGSKSPSET